MAQHKNLTSLFTAIANAIRAKTGGSDQIVADNFPDAISQIETGTQLPTLTDPGTASDMASGKQLIGQDGEIVTGSVNTVNSGTQSPINVTDEIRAPMLDGSSIVMWAKITTPTLFRTNSVAMIYASTSFFGNATAADVAAGKTFTSAAGVNVVGTGQSAAQVVDFGFLVQDSLSGDAYVMTDMAYQQGYAGGYQVYSGDSSAHTFQCSLGSIVAIEFTGDYDNIPAGDVFGFERMTIMNGNSGGKMYVFVCTAANAILRVNS